MDFDFLPKLPKSDLDDRTFQDLVDECILRIPRYCPEWTNYNPSDPGITLVELFAWLTDQMLMRLNQVPRRHYVAFLELLGVRLHPPTPAETEVTFYLIASLAEPYTIPPGTEVATLRTESEEAIVFSTSEPLTIGIPSVRHFLTSQFVEEQPQNLRDRFMGSWNLNPDQEWQGPELAFFEEFPQVGNCFYVVLNPENIIDGNVIALNIKGEAATSTGINPDLPPRRWEAWNGTFWQSVLLQEGDDGTQGFSFSELKRKGGNPLEGADVRLHLPRQFPITQFSTYQGRWLRCVYETPEVNQPAYSRSPRIVGLSVRSIGGTSEAYQCSTIRHEIVGESNGKPGQAFQLQSTPVMPRTEEEYLLITPPGGIPQIWQEVSDFANSTPQDLHYTIDSLTGMIQFGPLIREPAQLQESTKLRARSQGLSTSTLVNPNTHDVRESLERQYGAIPPRGSVVQMVAYRTGGGRKGNVQTGTIRILKSAVPYVARVTNHTPAHNGADVESLDDAVIRVPRLLRTRDRAVTAEDFETLAIEAGQGAIARAVCLQAIRAQDAGIVRLMVVPQVNLDGIVQRVGLAPEQFALNEQLQGQILSYLDERRLLGVQVQCQEPDYVGVSVQTEVALEPEYNNPRAQQQILSQLETNLYRFLNPIIGGFNGDGWSFGRPVYSSDIVTLFQSVPGVRYLGAVQLFELRRAGGNWIRTLPKEPVVDPGAFGLICSWRNDQLRSGHIISLI